MKITNGKILLIFGILHSLLDISPFAFGKQFSIFAKKFFFKISEGLLEFSLLHGVMHFENFAVFWFLYYSLLLIPLGIVVNFVEKNELSTQKFHLDLFHYCNSGCIHDSFFRDDIFNAATCYLYVSAKK